MDLTVWLAKLNPNDGLFLVFAVFSLLGAGRFVSQKIFPWLTEKYIPAQMAAEAMKFEVENKRELERNAVLGAIRDALTELRVTNQEIVREVRAHDAWSRDLAQRTAPQDVQEMMAADANFR